MSKKLLINLLLLNIILWCPQLSALSNPADDANAPAATPTAKGSELLLHGGIRHREYLDPVPPGLMAGARFDEQSLPQLVPGNNWIPIPAWLAGTWQFKTENVTEMQNFTNENYKQPPYTIRNESQKIFGQQQDKTGQVWHYLKAPYRYTSKLNHGLLGYEAVTSTEALDYNDQAVDLKLTGTDTTVNPKSQRVIHTDQSEEFHRYTQLGKDAILDGGSGKFFNMQGQPILEQTSNLMARRIKPFAVIDEKDGDNLKQLFADYLKSHGNADLLPSSD